MFEKSPAIIAIAKDYCQDVGRVGLDPARTNFGKPEIKTSPRQITLHTHNCITAALAYSVSLFTC
jgi:hypothetical protein